ncbi:MAG: mechanosensitive ion channel [Nitratireductor sp.]|nr:mechanosensitive ion channel [Nitratireductor sp.]MCC0020830.1 mechanosensitive ion channel [Nitratireductor sp.]
MNKYFDLGWWQEQGKEVLGILVEWFTSPQFYAQIAAILACVILALVAARQLKKHVSWFATPPEKEVQWYKIRGYVYALSDLLFPLLIYVLLGFAVDIVNAAVGSNWLVLIARGISVVFLLYSAINRFIAHPMLRSAALWLGIPVATLQVFGWLDGTIAFLDGISMQAGNIRISLYFLIKAALAGGFFFWLGSISSRTGQTAIRNQDALDIPTKELFAKLFQIALFAFLFVMLLQVLGLDLTALTIFGGALGVGIGFGLQQIAANFISGIILLVERSIHIGNYIELEDGRAGILKELNMRSATLETYDGKEIMVPNEKFITGTFVNWTRDDPRQRYEVEFLVANDTDIEQLPELIVTAVSEHPKVLNEPEMPDCELRAFEETGIKFGVEFWIEGIDDGRNRISSEVLFIIWRTLKANGIARPVPRRDVRLLGETAPAS